MYKPGNVGRQVNFFQKEDEEGLGMSPQVGIHGSPVEGAINRRVLAGKDLGLGGHGQIAYHPDVLKAWRGELLSVLRKVRTKTTAP